MNNEKNFDGWGWWDGVIASTVPSAWQACLASQTLSFVPAVGPNAFYLLAAGLPEQAPAIDPTLLERLAFTLLSWPDAELAVQPLHLATESHGPVAATVLAEGGLARIGQTGFIALGRARCLRLAGGAAPETALSALAEAGLPIMVSPKALLAETGTLASAPEVPVVKPVGLRAKLKAPLRRCFPIELRTFLRRMVGRLPPKPAAPGPVDPLSTTDPGLARHRAWEPRFPHPRLALRPQTQDGRTTVWFAVHWLELGGAEKFAVDLIRKLPKDRYRVVVTTDVPSANTWAGLVAEHADAILHLPEFLGGDGFNAFAAHFIASRGVQLLHIHHAPRIYQALPYIRRLFPDLKILHTLHILELPPYSGGYPEYTLREFGAFIDHHHVISRHLERFLRQRWEVPASRVDVVYLNVDIGRFDPARVPRGEVRARHGIPGDAVLIGFVGRFVRQKRPLEFIAMAARLRGRWARAGFPHELHFVMAGDGGLRAEVERAIHDEGLGGWVHLHGEVLDTRPVFADSDMVVLSSENEGLALVGYEAMAMGRPVISTDVGAQRELVPQELLVAEGSAVERHLADIAWELAVDAELRARVGARCREHVLAWHRQDQTFGAMGGLYRRLLGDGAVEAATVSVPDGLGWRLDEPALVRCAARIPVAVAVVSYNHREALVTLLEFLDGKGIPTFVTENASTDGTREAIRGRFPHVAVLESEANLGGTGGFNCAVLAALDANSDYVLLIDDDALPRGDCIERLARFLDDHADYSFAAPAIYISGTEDTLQEAGGGVDFTRPLAVEAWHRFKVGARLPAYLEVDYASACCLMVRADDIREIGVMDWNFFIFSDDVDWTLRLRRGLGKRGACVTGARADHDFPWTKPFSPMRLYYFVRNGIYLAARYAEGESRGRALLWAVRRPLRRMIYAAAIGDREVALTLWRALRDAWSGTYGRWADPVAFPTARSAVDAEYLRRHRVVRVLVDISIEDIDKDILVALRALGGDALRVDVLCDTHRGEAYRKKGLFERVLERSPGMLRGQLQDWWRVYRAGYDWVVTDACMDPRRPSSAAGRHAAFFHAGGLYNARAPGWLAPMGYVFSYVIAAGIGALLHRRFLDAPEPGKPSTEAARLLESLGYDGSVGQPWARTRK